MTLAPTPSAAINTPPLSPAQRTFDLIPPVSYSLKFPTPSENFDELNEQLAQSIILKRRQQLNGRKTPPMKTSTITRTDATNGAKPPIPTIDHETQAFRKTRKQPIALDQTTCNASIDNLNQVLADTITLRDLYKKHHWQVSGPTFMQLHLLFDKHFQAQLDLVDQIAERVQILGGIAIAMAHDVAESSLIPRAPKGREDPASQLARLLHAHEVILEESRAMARNAAKNGDDGTNDLLVSNVIRTNELHVWFLSMHLA